MLHTNEHVIVPFTFKSALGFLLLLFVLTFPLWRSWFHSTTAASPQGLAGNWVGQATITSAVLGMGNSRKMHQDAMLYLSLASYDSVLKKVHGEGRLCIEGEQGGRDIHVATLGPPKPDGRVNGMISGDLYAPETSPALQVAGAGRVVQGLWDGQTLQLHAVDNGSTVGYIFEASLYRGNQADFVAGCRQLQAK